MLAIVIPYYKHTFFRETMFSLSQQLDKRFKVYVGDDGSPEDPTDIIKEFEDSFDLTYKKFDTNLGGTSLVNHWNRCLDLLGSEEWFIILGDDDWLTENYVAEFYGYPNKSDTNVLRCPTIRIGENGEIIGERFSYPEKQRAIEFLFNKKRSTLSEYIFNADKLKSIGFRNLPLAWLSDVLAVLEFSEFGDIHTIPGGTAYIRTSTQNISGRTDNLRPKAQAAFLFYHVLLTQHQTKFSGAQQKTLLEWMTKAYLNNKKDPVAFFSISRLYFKLTPGNYFSFLRQILRSISFLR